MSPLAQRRDSTAGITVVEIVVALVVFSIGILSTLSLLGVATRDIRASGSAVARETARRTVAIEALDCGAGNAGGAVEEGIGARWEARGSVLRRADLWIEMAGVVDTTVVFSWCPP